MASDLEMFTLHIRYTNEDTNILKDFQQFIVGVDTNALNVISALEGECCGDDMQMGVRNHLHFNLNSYRPESWWRNKIRRSKYWSKSCYTVSQIRTSEVQNVRYVLKFGYEIFTFNLYHIIGTDYTDPEVLKILQIEGYALFCSKYHKPAKNDRLDKIRAFLLDYQNNTTDGEELKIENSTLMVDLIRKCFEEKGWSIGNMQSLIATVRHFLLEFKIISSKMYWGQIMVKAENII